MVLPNLRTFTLNNLPYYSLCLDQSSSSCLHCAHKFPSGCSADVGAECSVELPKRVFLPWHNGTFLCDYLLNGETLETVNLMLPLQYFFSFRYFIYCTILRPDQSVQFVLVQDVKERCDELFAVNENFDASQILQPELSAIAPPATLFSDLVFPKRTPSPEVSVVLKHSGKQDSLPHSLVLIGALVTLLIAMLLALILLK